jgi:hypothetical protein
VADISSGRRITEDVAIGVGGGFVTLGAVLLAPSHQGLVVVVGIVLCIGAIAAAEIRRRPSSGPEALEPRYNQSPPYRTMRGADTGIVWHSVGIFNPSTGSTARRVGLHLVGMEPHPRHVLMNLEPFIPYVVPLASGGDASVGVTLGPRREVGMARRWHGR